MIQNDTTGIDCPDNPDAAIAAAWRYLFAHGTLFLRINPCPSTLQMEFMKCCTA